MTLRVCSAIALTLACGGPPPPKKPPPPLDAKQVAALVYADFVALADTAHRLRGHCTQLIAELGPRVARMQQTKTEVDRVLRDAKQAGELKTELATYADRTKTLTDTIATDLAATYLECCPRARDEPAPQPQSPPPRTDGDAPVQPRSDSDERKLPPVQTSCPTGYQLERAIAGIPTY
jgi:hypothetical protein